MKHFTIATAKINGEWFVVDRSIEDVTGKVTDKILSEALSEPQAEQRATTMALERGDAEREAIKLRWRESSKARTKRKPNTSGKKAGPLRLMRSGERH